jgi:SWI/SNF chromatin-remodeling complex subunit SWI1
MLSHFDLPEQMLFPPSNTPVSVAATLSQYYMAILYPFEEAYKRNLQDQQRKAIAAGSRQPGVQPQQPSAAGPAQGRLPQAGLNGVVQAGLPTQTQSGTSLQVPGLPNLPAGSLLNGVSQYSQPSNAPVTPQTPHLRPPSSAANTNMQPSPSQTNAQSSRTGPTSDPIPGNQAGHGFPGPPLEKEVFDSDVQGIKRKLDSEEVDSKRVRQKTGKSVVVLGSSILSYLRS